MTTATPNRRLLNAALITRLASVSTVDAGPFKFDLARVPEDIELDANLKLVKPYGILYPLVGYNTSGDLELPQRHARLPYQLTSVGQIADHAQWLSDFAKNEVLLKRNPGGDFTNPITASDTLVIDRTCSMHGGPEPSGGGLWQVVDRFDLEVISA